MKTAGLSRGRRRRLLSNRTARRIPTVSTKTLGTDSAPFRAQPRSYSVDDGTRKACRPFRIRRHRRVGRTALGRDRKRLVEHRLHVRGRVNRLARRRVRDRRLARWRGPVGDVDEERRRRRVVATKEGGAGAEVLRLEGTDIRGHTREGIR